MTIEERTQKAVALFHSGYNCAQSVVAAFDDLFGDDARTATALAASFGGGMGRMREVWGTVSGMSMLAALISPAADPSDKNARTANYALVQNFAGEFRRQCGSIICRELLGLPSAAESPEPSDRTPEYYRKRPCAEYVACAARIVGEYLAEKGCEL